MASSLIYVMPLLAFLFIFLVCYALFSKTKILGENETFNALVSLLIALMFIANPPATKFTLATVPWIAVLIFVLLFVLLVLTFVHGKIDDLVQSRVVAFILVAVVLIVFLAASVNVFGPLINLISSGTLEPEQASGALSIILNPTILGAIIILIISALTYWFFTQGKEFI